MNIPIHGKNGRNGVRKKYSSASEPSCVFMGSTTEEKPQPKTCDLGHFRCIARQLINAIIVEKWQTTFHISCHMNDSKAMGLNMLIR